MNHPTYEVSDLPLDKLINKGAYDPRALLRDARVRLLLATTPSWLFELPPRTLYAVVACPECPLRLVEHLASDRSRPLMARMGAARRPDMPPEKLRLFMNHAGMVREELACNPSLPEDLEAILAEDRFSYVRAAIAQRTSNTKLIRKLSRDRSLHRVRASVARNPYLTTEARAYLSRSSISDIQRALQNNRSGR